MLGRLAVKSATGECRLDVIPEAKGLRAASRRESGYVISHVGEWLPSSGEMTVAEAEAVTEMLHLWFGLLRGAWAGPLFPQGLVDGEILWRQIASWKLGERRQVTTWMPELKPLELSGLFSGFQGRWSEDLWREALVYAISWLVEANSSGTAMESRIVLAQVALDLLAWVDLVEAHGFYSRTAFDRMRAKGRMHALLGRMGVPIEVPDHMAELGAFCDASGFGNGPEVITWLRNSLVHSSDKKRGEMKSLEGMVWYQCSQLALQYLELALLWICGYRGNYARRAFKGSKGEDEVLVPWADSPA
jgi:hypothetical protein